MRFADKELVCESPLTKLCPKKLESPFLTRSIQVEIIGFHAAPKLQVLSKLTSHPVLPFSKYVLYVRKNHITASDC